MPPTDDAAAAAAGPGPTPGLSARAGDLRVSAAVAVNLLLTVAQVAGGVLAGSLALVADALHNLSDAISLGIALVARRLARRPSDAGMTFGYGRAEVVAALVNYTTLIVLGVGLLGEAAFRLVDPPAVDGWPVVLIALLALVVDVVTVLLTRSMARGSVNIRAAFLHNLADALGSIGVIVAGSLVLLYDWRLADPLATLAIAGYILLHAGREVGPVIRILMLGSPPSLDTGQVMAAIRDLDGVADLHHVRLWRMEEHAPALDAHLVVEATDWPDAEATKRRVKDMLAARFAIHHATLELEPPDAACGDRRAIGHPPWRADL